MLTAHFDEPVHRDEFGLLGFGSKRVPVSLRIYLSKTTVALKTFREVAVFWQGELVEAHSGYLSPQVATEFCGVKHSILLYVSNLFLRLSWRKHAHLDESYILERPRKASLSISSDQSSVCWRWRRCTQLFCLPLLHMLDLNPTAKRGGPDWDGVEPGMHQTPPGHEPPADGVW